MEVLDTSIANVALPHIAGDLGASNDESTWVLTSYLVPTRLFFRERMVRGNFRAEAFLHDLHPDFHGDLAAVRNRVEPGMAAVRARGAGSGRRWAAADGASDPGGHVSAGKTRTGFFALWSNGNRGAIDRTGRWAAGSRITTRGDGFFYINLPVGIVALWLVYRLIEDPEYISKNVGRSLRVDYIGFGLLALGVGALQILLDKDKRTIGLGRIYFDAGDHRGRVPGVAGPLRVESQRTDCDVRLFKNLNFSTACLVMFMVGALSFASTVLMPQFLQTLMRYTAEKAGLVMSAAALVLLMELPLVGRLTTKVQGRHLVAFGWLALACTMYLSTKRIDLQISFGSATWLRILQYIPLGFIFIPLRLWHTQEFREKRIMQWPGSSISRGILEAAWNFAGDDDHCAANAVPPGNADGARFYLESELSRRHSSDGAEADARGA